MIRRDDDMVTFTVSGASGSDTVNFVFIQAAKGPGLTLEGTSGKDVIFATEGSDTLTGGGGEDQFVFDGHVVGPCSIRSPTSRPRWTRSTSGHTAAIDIHVRKSTWISSRQQHGDHDRRHQRLDTAAERAGREPQTGNFIFHAVLVA